MADRYNAVDNVDLLAALGGTVSAADNVFLVENDTTYTGSLNFSATELADFTAEPGWTGNMGAAGNVLQLDLTGTLDWRFGGDYAYISGVAANTLASVIVAPVRQAQVVFSTATITLVKIYSGQSVKFLDSVALTTVHAIGGITIIDAHASDTVDTLVVGGKVGAQCWVYRSAGTVTITAGGVLNVMKRALTMTTLNLNGSARCNHKGGAITTVNTAGAGNILDLSGVVADITIGTLAGTGSLEIIKPRGSATLTITTNNLDASLLTIRA
jgi:hypothetical protein